MRYPFIFVVLLLANTASAIEISNINIGVLDPETKNIIPNTESVKYKPNGSCTVGGRLTTCMWWGLAFTYRGLETEKYLTCTSKTSKKVHASTKDWRDDKEESEFTGRLQLDTNKSQFLGEYFVEKEPGDSGAVALSLVCTYQNNVVIQRAFTVEF